MTDPAHQAALLEETFRTIQRERMGDVPILHPALQVEAVGFRDWNGYSLGVLVTPWFMSLILLPVQPGEWDGLRVGSSQHYIFPAGQYDFTLAHEVGIGYYRSCSLFSPMSPFPDQATAVATAASVMEELFRAPQPLAATALPQDPGKGFVEEVKRQSERPMTRRDLLRGLFLRGAK
jgi:[NiFe] hydrogenase assembly HybE family chaperone